jgi:hypothetical protein
MNEDERKKLLTDIENQGGGIGGLPFLPVARTLVNSILGVDSSVTRLDISSGRLAKINILLTAVVLLVALVQALVAGDSRKSEPAQRFTMPDNEASPIGFDSKTGLVCASGFGATSQKQKIGDTFLAGIAGGAFVPFCADLYAHEDRVLRDFNSFLHQPDKPEQKQ